MNARAALYAALFCVFGVTATLAQTTPEPATPQVIESETRMADLPGPRPNTTRAILIWRAPSTPASGVLPTLYLADGANALYLVAARLRPLIEAGAMPPVQLIALTPDLDHRQDEYIQRGRPRYRAHETCVLQTVIPWAERVARASPEQSAIGGYSNGAAFALFMAADHPDILSGVLAHSPVATADSFRVDPRAAHVRWALSAGRQEYNGYPFGAVTTVQGAAAAQGAAVRLCTGGWGHDPYAWADLSPGAIAWLFSFPGANAAATPLERENCHETPAR